MPTVIRCRQRGDPSTGRLQTILAAQQSQLILAGAAGSIHTN